MKEVVGYVRDKDYRPIGCLVGIRDSHGSWFGWSKYFKHDENPLSKKVGREIATARANSRDRKYNIHDLPHDIRKSIPNFTDRCRKAFREEDLEGFDNLEYKRLFRHLAKDSLRQSISRRMEEIRNLVANGRPGN